MAIKKKLIHFKTKANFLKEKEAGNILNTSIVFIKDTKEIWTHGEYYPNLPEGLLTLEEAEELFYSKEEVDEMFVDTSDTNGYDYVDLGEAGIWATCNIGASKPEETGLYFAWGETEGYNNATKDKTFSWNNYKHASATEWLYKYCTYGGIGTVDNKLVLEPEDDAAHVNMGGDWRMPTEQEFQKLYDLCNKTWTTQNGVNGLLFILKTDSSKQLFFPASGIISRGAIADDTSSGDYWSSSLYTYQSKNKIAYALRFNSSEVEPRSYTYTRVVGMQIRGFISNNKSPKYLTKKEASSIYEPKFTPGANLEMTSDRALNVNLDIYPIADTDLNQILV